MPPTVMVIDDNPMVREVLRSMLEYRGYLVVVAESGASALRMFAKHQIDAAFVDFDMPQMNGIEVCRALRVRAAEIGQTLFVWLMTGFTRPEVDAGAAAAGALGVLAKPLTSDELVSCIAQARSENQEHVLPGRRET